MIDAEFPEGILENYTPIEYEKYHCVSPGVVLIKSPGHSVGHQFIYVQLQNGSEFLFTGDVVWVNKNFETKKSRPWIASKKRLENRNQIAHQMKFLYDEFYSNENQKINMLPTHDPEVHKDYISKGIIHKGILLKNKKEGKDYVHFINTYQPGVVD
jgi:glyoxylase-like metal-dependent hydrolase (beta-lactamase superfamily II)